MCEHDEEMRNEYAGWTKPTAAIFCGDDTPHAPHRGCLGIMCDYGCNAEYF